MPWGEFLTIVFQVLIAGMVVIFLAATLISFYRTFTKKD